MLTNFPHLIIDHRGDQPHMTASFGADHFVGLAVYVNRYARLLFVRQRPDPLESITLRFQYKHIC